MDLEKLHQTLRFDNERQFQTLLWALPESPEIKNEILFIACTHNCPKCIKKLLGKGSSTTKFDRWKALEKAIQRGFTENIPPLLMYPSNLEPARLIEENHKLLKIALECANNLKTEGALMAVKLLLSKYPQEELIKLRGIMEEENLIDKLPVVDKEIKLRAMRQKRKIELTLKELI